MRPEAYSFHDLVCTIVALCAADVRRQRTESQKLGGNRGGVEGPEGKRGRQSSSEESQNVRARARAARGRPVGRARGCAA
eukprot:4133844-Pleurochrysis_carterae.AAC.1